MTEHREAPTSRINPSGTKVWIARWTDKTGKRRVGYPPDIKGTYKLRRAAQDAIDRCYELDAHGPSRRGTVRAYLETWLDDHPRVERTATVYRSHVKSVLEVPVDGRPFGDWPMQDVRRSHAKRLITVLLVDQGRSAGGARKVLDVLQTMFRDATDDEYVTTANPFAHHAIRLNDPRIRKWAPPIRVLSWEQMHAFADAAPGTYGRAMVRVLADCGLRVGEMLALERRHVGDGVLEVRQTAWERRVQAGTKTDHGMPDAGRTVPLTPFLEAVLRGLPPRIDSRFLFPAQDGGVWSYSAFRHRVWTPAQKATGLDCRPHEFRHSWVSLLRAARVDAADLAAAAGHTVDVADSVYTHALQQSFDQIRQAVDGRI